jgi:hypothetical protein
MKASKKDMLKHAKKHDKELGHFEGKYWCDCKTRGYRHYLAKKLYGKERIEAQGESA